MVVSGVYLVGSIFPTDNPPAPQIPSTPSSPARTCANPIVRREWRAMHESQQQDYLRAVKCLKTIPSRLGKDHTLYDDFPYVHSRTGKKIHDAAPFLAWHRYFLHIYESALKTECSYDGTLPYWNWRLDFTNITSSPIFSPRTGFGGNGSPSLSTESILDGYCVSTGPFSFTPIPYLDDEFHPHCLSRGWLDGDELREQAWELRPEAVDALMAEERYEGFNLGLEHGPHLAVPRTIGGDFLLLTAPSDPVFFLHHGQLDHLWKQWQDRDQRRVLQYSGVRAHGSEEMAEVTDLLDMGGLAKSVHVSDILRTDGDFLCYTYD
ncbi:monooxygenase [Sporormia fimetaria CBS 119925]|uniref:Monooxygenase n=1 Tax=Sporormia fimetaria CBS 119925 TaxID=1340428 RepID=A0A6A6VF46_9PLEO|nr:monooxygenase [Sporormia fimetaria CBS 119925]